MGSLMGQTKLIPGFRFHPTDVELVKYFLKRKVMGKKFSMDVIADVDIYKYAPWDLPDKSSLQVGDLEWYFFCPKGTKYARGARMNRATEVGYWKTTGRDRPIQHNNQIVGMIKTLVFHIGRAPRGDRTDWVMHEYKLEDKELADKAILQDSYVLCKVFQKDGPGPRNGANYGKPFNEEEWETDEEKPSGEEPVHSADLPAPDSMVPATQYNSIVSDLHLVDSKCIEKSSVTCLLGPKPSSSPSPCRMPDSGFSDRVISYDRHGVSADNVKAVMLDYFGEDNTLASCGNNNTEVVDNCGWENNANGMPCFDINEFFKDLGDLDDLSGLGEDGDHSTFDQQAENFTNQMFPNLDYDDFLKLDDLKFPLFDMEHDVNLIENERERK